MAKPPMLGIASNLLGRSDNPIAPVAEAIAIAVDRNRRLGDKAVQQDQIRNAGMMDTQRGQYRRRLRAFVGQLIAELYLHGLAPLGPKFGERNRERQVIPQPGQGTGKNQPLEFAASGASGLAMANGPSTWR